MVKAIETICNFGFNISIEKRDGEWVVTLRSGAGDRTEFCANDFGLAFGDAYEWVLRG